MNKGFTLIEVLAVLLILSIIAVITTPIISGVIRDSREKAFISDVNSLIDSLRTYQANNNYKAVTINYTTGSNKNLLKTDGDLPDAGGISINENGKVKLALWNDNLKICVQKGLNDKEIIKKEISKTQCKL